MGVPLVNSSEYLRQLEDAFGMALSPEKAFGPEGQVAELSR